MTTVNKAAKLTVKYGQQIWGSSNYQKRTTRCEQSLHCGSKETFWKDGQKMVLSCQSVFKKVGNARLLRKLNMHGYCVTCS